MMLCLQVNLLLRCDPQALSVSERLCGLCDTVFVTVPDAQGEPCTTQIYDI
jgi:hypothetical protein